MKQLCNTLGSVFQADWTGAYHAEIREFRQTQDKF